MRRFYAWAFVALSYFLSSCIDTPKTHRSEQKIENLVCRVSDSGATVLCKRKGQNGGLGALIELHPDFNDGSTCFHTKGNQNLCDLNLVSTIGERYFGKQVGELYSAEAVGLATNF